MILFSIANVFLDCPSHISLTLSLSLVVSLSLDFLIVFFYFFYYEHLPLSVVRFFLYHSLWCSAPSRWQIFCWFLSVYMTPFFLDPITVRIQFDPKSLEAFFRSLLPVTFKKKSGFSRTWIDDCEVQIWSFRLMKFVKMVKKLESFPRSAILLTNLKHHFENRRWLLLLQYSISLRSRNSWMVHCIWLEMQRIVR